MGEVHHNWEEEVVRSLMAGYTVLEDRSYRGLEEEDPQQPARGKRGAEDTRFIISATMTTMVGGQAQTQRPFSGYDEVKISIYCCLSFVD